ncbi:hypothetical protein CDV31_001649 [Fusarium ambrosium]|uniref:Uncharacterized protein n=1 Tax=Fusarium ambrosium TaxID=131363 RepID=A0A428UYW6_9HYPO|nr:hypothetical protein CDV31_001649 [Fusarium ambrosium]
MPARDLRNQAKVELDKLVARAAADKAEKEKEEKKAEKPNGDTTSEGVLVQTWQFQSPTARELSESPAGLVEMG